MSDDEQDAPRLPVIYSSGDNQVVSRSVVGPSAKDIADYGQATRTTCATCKAFKYQAGQEAMKAERFMERLVLEEQWKAHHLGAPPSTFGLCGMSNDTLTSIHTKACDQYIPRNGRIREDGDW